MAVELAQVRDGIRILRYRSEKLVNMADWRAEIPWCSADRDCEDRTLCMLNRNWANAVGTVDQRRVWTLVSKGSPRGEKVIAHL